MISISLLTISLCVCLILSVRRIYRNNIYNNRLRKQIKFENDLNIALKKKTFFTDSRSFNPVDTSIINEVLLKYFRMLKGVQAERLQEIIDSLNIESDIQAATKSGTTGRRMEAMQILSYLNSHLSLQTIHKGLSSSNKYIVLTAARCLTRRQANIFVDDIIYYINSNFPEEEKLLADILFRFGSKVTNTLEFYIDSDASASVKAACLEALVLIMPPATSLDFDKLIEHQNEKVRAATLALSDVTSHNSSNDILIKSMGDISTKVKIRAAKMAYMKRRKDTISPLFKLTNDPLLWVRYWSTKAIWNTGRQGRKFVETMSSRNEKAGRMAREVSLENRINDEVIL